MLRLMIPLTEVREKSLAKHVSHDSTRSELTPSENISRFFEVVLLQPFDPRIHIVVHRVVVALQSSLLFVTDELGEAGLQRVLLVRQHELNGGHVGVHQMSVVAQVVSPSLDTVSQGPQSNLLFKPSLNP